MKCKIIFLGGGLGNNLFQIAYGEHLKNNGYNVYYNDFLTRDNRITRFLGWSIHSNSITEKLLKDDDVSSKLKIIDLVYLASVFLKKKLFNIKGYDICLSDKKRYFGYAAVGEHLNKGVLLGMSKKLKKILEPKAGLEVADTVLHIRRGDFSKECTLTDEYYIRALQKLNPSCTVTIVTDDPSIIDYVKKNIHENSKVSSGNSMVDDFITISNAKNLIMSNSTYCYWACVLGTNENVIYPSRISNKQNWIFYLNDINAKEVNCTFLSELSS